MFLHMKSSVIASLKLTIDTRRVHIDNKYPIVIRLTVNSLSTSITTGIKLFKNEWDNIHGKVLKNNPKYKELNFYLLMNIASFYTNK
jgi:hypothetical protein